MVNSDINALEKQLDSPVRTERLNAVKSISVLDMDSEWESSVVANNHIHTTYSFSPYTPAKAVWLARKSGLAMAGIMDHDSISGVREFKAAAAMLGFPVTVGCECRVSLAETDFRDTYINSPDQKGLAYVALHAIPEQSIDPLDALFAPLRLLREKRNRLMTAKLNAALTGSGIELDYDRDVRPLSMADEGGSVTERHILFALASAMTDRLAEPAKIVDFLDALGVETAGKTRSYLLDDENPFYRYDLLGALKANLGEKFSITANEELLMANTLATQAKELGVVFAYPYLGDVAESPTGDKKAQKFEDDFLDDLFPTLKNLGFDAVTYMPTRNTPAQIARLQGLCAEYEMLEICGEDINSPRQQFISPALRQSEFAYLREAAFALVGHERLAAQDLEDGMFSEKIKKRLPELKDRIAWFSGKGKRHNEQL